MTLRAFVFGLEGFDAHACVSVALGQLNVAARPYVAFVLVMNVALELRALGVKIAARVLEIVVVSRILTGVHFFANVPTVEVLF